MFKDRFLFVQIVFVICCLSFINVANSATTKALFDATISPTAVSNGDYLASAQEAALLVGQGFDSERDLGRAACLNGSWVFQGSPYGEVKVDASMSHAELRIKGSEPMPVS